MSYVFDGVDDNMVFTPGYSEPASYTIAGWIKLASFGGGSRGRIFLSYDSTDPARVGGAVLADAVNLTNGLAFIAGFDNTDGYWGANNTLRTGHWIAFAITYNPATPTTPPVIYTMDPDNGDTSLVSRTVSTVQSPVGSPWTINSYLVGNNNPSLNTRVFDGKMAYLQRFSAQLSSGNANSAVTNPGSYTTGRVLALDFQSGASDSSGSGYTPTVFQATLDSGDNPSVGGGGSLTSRSFAGTVTPTAGVAEMTLSLNALAATVTPTTALTAQKLAGAYQRSFAGTVTPVTNLTIVVNNGLRLKSIAGTVTPTTVLFTVKNPSAGGGGGFPLRFLQPRNL